MLAFGKQAEQIEPLNHIRVTQSLQGVALPVVMGTARVPGLLIWYGDFAASRHNAGGSAFGMKGSAIYTYNASWISALCQGPIAGIQSVWDSSGKYVPKNATTLFSIPSATPPAQPTYTFPNPNFAADQGVMGPNGVPFTRVLIDTGQAPPTLSTGQYTADVNGVYTFSNSDSGKSVSIYNSYYWKYRFQQELQLITPGSPPTVKADKGGIGADGQPIYGVDCGVRYYPSGTPLVKVGSNPQQGQYTNYVNSQGIGVYTFNSADVNQEILLLYQFDDYQDDPYAPAQISATFFAGLLGQAGWSYMSTDHPGQYLNYSQVAYAGFQHAYLGMSGVPPINSYEVMGFNMIGGGVIDASPVDSLYTLLTDTHVGIGFPVEYIDQASWYTNSNSAQNWCKSLNLFISQAIKNQRSVSSIASQWLEAFQISAFWSEGLLKLVPFGDQGATGSLASYVPNTAIVVNVTDDVWTSPKGTPEDPVKVTRSPWTDAYNRVQVGYQNRLNDYNTDLVYEQDEASIERHGLRIEPPVSYEFIPIYQTAAAVASLRLKRNVLVRNKYQFKLPIKYEYLEPMDLIQITDARLGLNQATVRVTRVDNDYKNGLSITAEDYPGNGYAMPVVNPKAFTPPLHPVYSTTYSGQTSAVVVQATNNNGNVNNTRLYIYCIGDSPYWGGCIVWASLDGSTYTQIASVTESARIGYLLSALPSVTPNPSGALHLTADTTSTLAISFGTTNVNASTAGIPAWVNTENYTANQQVVYDAQLWVARQNNTNSTPTISNPDWQLITETIPAETPLTTVSATAAANLGTLCAVIALSANLTPSAIEFLSYETVNPGTNPNTYNLTNLYRGAYLTTIGSFAAGSQFVRFDDASAVYDVPAGYVGNTIYLRFTAMNLMAGATQDLANVDTYEFVLQATGDGAADFGPAASSQLNTQGSLVSGGTSANFTYTSNDNSITWSWTAFDIYNMDGTVAASIAAGSAPVFGSLNASTTYYFGAYYDVVLRAVVMVLSDSGSPVGTQQSSLAQIAQVLATDTHILLFGNATAATAASGGSGGGGGGGTGGCFSAATKVRTPNGMVRFDQLPKRFQIVNSRGTFDARLLIHSGEWEMIDIGGGVQCTVRHLFRDDAGNIKEAQEIHPDKTSFTLHGRVYNLHVESDDPDDHWFECGDGITAHNYFPIKP